MTKVGLYRPRPPFEYECVDCSRRVRAEHHPGTCSDCGGQVRDVPGPRE